jgi:hypothetical protein
MTTIEIWIPGRIDLTVGHKIETKLERTGEHKVGHNIEHKIEPETEPRHSVARKIEPVAEPAPQADSKPPREIPSSTHGAGDGGGGESSEGGGGVGDGGGGGGGVDTGGGSADTGGGSDGSAGGGSAYFLSSQSALALGLATAALTAIAAEHLTPGFDNPIFALLMARSIVPADETTWIPREAVEKRFRAYLHGPPGEILVVSGPKAAGKSTAALHALRDVRGATLVKLKGQDDLSKKLLVAVGMPFIGRNTDVDIVSLTRMFKSAIWWRRLLTGDEAWLPTFLVEVDGMTDASHINNALVTLKRLACDRGACRAIVVLGDTDAALALSKDRARNDNLWFGDFSPKEASAYLDAANALIGEDKLREELLDVTTRPGELWKLLKELAASPAVSSETITRKFLEDMRGDARGRVIDLLKLDDAKTRPDQGLHFRRLLKDMVKNGGSVSQEAASYMTSVKQVVECIKDSSGGRAVVYDHTAREYRFNTPADMHAAASLC